MPTVQSSRAPWNEAPVTPTRTPSWLAPPSSHEPVASGFPAGEPHAEARSRTQPPSAAPAATTPVASSLPAPSLSISTREWETQIATLQEQLASVLRGVPAIRKRLLEASERDLVRLALVIAEKVVGRELQTDEALVSRWAREGIDALVEGDRIEVVVSPDVAEAVPNDAWVDGDGKRLEPIVDSALAPGTCTVKSELSRVNAGIAARLDAVAQALGLPSDEPPESGGSA